MGHLPLPVDESLWAPLPAESNWNGNDKIIVFFFLLNWSVMAITCWSRDKRWRRNLHRAARDAGSFLFCQTGSYPVHKSRLEKNWFFIKFIGINLPRRLSIVLIVGSIQTVLDYWQKHLEGLCHCRCCHHPQLMTTSDAGGDGTFPILAAVSSSAAKRLFSWVFSAPLVHLLLLLYSFLLL